MSVCSETEKKIRIRSIFFDCETKLQEYIREKKAQVFSAQCLKIVFMFSAENKILELSEKITKNFLAVYGMAIDVVCIMDTQGYAFCPDDTLYEIIAKRKKIFVLYKKNNNAKNLVMLQEFSQNKKRSIQEEENITKKKKTETSKKSVSLETKLVDKKELEKRSSVDIELNNASALKNECKKDSSKKETQKVPLGLVEEKTFVSEEKKNTEEKRNRHSFKSFHKNRK